MKNQGFGPLKLFLVPFLPLVWWMDRQSENEILDEIVYNQNLESTRIRPYQQFIDLAPEDILWGENGGRPNIAVELLEVIGEDFADIATGSLEALPQTDLFGRDDEADDLPFVIEGY